MHIINSLIIFSVDHVIAKPRELRCSVPRRPSAGRGKGRAGRRDVTSLPPTRTHVERPGRKTAALRLCFQGSPNGRKCSISRPRRATTKDYGDRGVPRGPRDEKGAPRRTVPSGRISGVIRVLSTLFRRKISLLFIRFTIFPLVTWQKA